MELLQFPSLSTLLAFFIFLSVVVNVVKRVKTTNSSIKLPPGPWKLPLIGNLHQLVGSPPHHILRDLAKQHGPLMHLQLGEVSAIVVSSPEIAKEVMVTQGVTFAQRPYVLAFGMVTYGCKDIAMAQYGKLLATRKICTVELFTSKRVQSFQSISEEEVSALVKSISSNERLPININEKIFSSTYGITSRAAFGNKCKDQDAYALIVEEITKLASGFSVADLYLSIRVLHLISGMR